jgi:hypothetical protein
MFRLESLLYYVENKLYGGAKEMANEQRKMHE